jgi:hypothetical protein
MNDKVEAAIKQLASISAQKDVVCIELFGNCNDQGIFEVRMTNPPKLTDNVSHKISLVSFQTTSFFPNLIETNNKFYYRNGTDAVDKVVTVDTGGYDIKDYYDAISTAMTVNGDEPKNLVIELIKASGKTRITLKNGYKVYFNKDNTWRDVLGFAATNLTRDGVYTSDKISHVVATEKVYAKCNLCTGTYFNGETTNILFSFPNKRRYGALLFVDPNPLIPRKLSNTNIDKIRLEFVDEDGNPVSFLRSPICMTILIEQM